MKSPMLVLACCFALGIALAQPEHVGVSSLPILLVFASACLLVGVVALRAEWRRASSLLALAGFVFAGAAAARLFELRFPPQHISHLAEWGVNLADPIRLEGMLVSAPLHTPYGLQFDLRLKRLESLGQIHSATGTIRLRLQNSSDGDSASADSLHLEYGDSIRALVRLRRPPAYQNPGCFDLRRWMESIEDRYWDGTIKSFLEKLPAASADKPPMLAALCTRMRNYLLRSIDRLYPPWFAEGRNGAVLKAVLLGERSSLDSETIDNFRKSGLYHLLVIAGLHVGLLAMLAELLLRFLGLRESWRSVLVLVFLLGYALLVEQRAPTLRATLMITAYLLARFLYREHVGLNAIGLVALLLLCSRPAWLYESGFQLSFIAALLIAGLVAPILERTTEPYRVALYQLQSVDRDLNLPPRLAQFRLDLRSVIARLKARVAFLERYPAVASAAVVGPVRTALWTVSIVLFSTILQFGLLLPMVAIFHRVTFAGIGLNALAIPVMTVLLGLAVPTVILGATVPVLALWPAKVVAVVLSGLFTLTDLPNLPSWLSYRVPDPPLWVAWGFAVSIVAAAFALGRSRQTFRASLTALGIFATLICAHPFPPRLPDSVLEVTALDCGGGDAVFLVLPDRTTLLVGAGGRDRRKGAPLGRRWNPGENIVSPYLWSRGIGKIDILVLTGASGEELEGLASVAANFRVRELWHGPSSLTPPYEMLLEQLGRQGIRVRQLAAGDVIVRGKTTLQFLWPPPSQSLRPSLHDALVMRILDGESSVLLPGDIATGVEQALLRSGFPLKSRVLKVIHHSSRLTYNPSSDFGFLMRVGPQVALVNAGEENFLNLLDRESLDWLRSLGTRVLRTDLDGAVTVEMKGSSLSVRCYRSSR